MYLFVFVGLLMGGYCYGQHTQKLRGKVTDKESRTALIGVSVILPDLPSRPGAVTDADGD